MFRTERGGGYASCFRVGVPGAVGFPVDRHRCSQSNKSIDAVLCVSDEPRSPESRVRGIRSKKINLNTKRNLTTNQAVVIVVIG